MRISCINIEHTLTHSVLLVFLVAGWEVLIFNFINQLQQESWPFFTLCEKVMLFFSQSKLEIKNSCTFSKNENVCVKTLINTH